MTPRSARKLASHGACFQCHQVKEIKYFHRNPTGVFGRRGECAECNVKRHRKYYDVNKEKENLRIKLYRNSHPIETKLRWVNWIKKNKVHYLQYQREWVKNHRKNNISFRLAHYQRSRIYHALKGNHKSLSTMFLIGCEIDYLMFHLQSQFKPGMSWDNYGTKGWVIDHIIPCSKFNLSKKSEQIKCFNYSNMQPLWDKENRQKSNH